MDTPDQYPCDGMLKHAVTHHDPFRLGEIQIGLRLPGKTEVIRTAIKLDPREFCDFQPLPRAREIVFEDMVEARRQEENRTRLAQAVARAVTAHIMKTVEADDTVNGYTKEENRRFREGV